MADTVTDEGFLLALLNSTPVDRRGASRRPRRPRPGPGLAGRRRRPGHRGRTAARAARSAQALQAVVRGQQPADVLAPALQGVTSVPAIDGGRVGWTLSVAPDRELAVRAILAWDALARQSPGTAAPVRERRMPPVPHRPQQGQRRPVVLDGRLRQPDEGPPPLPALTRLAPRGRRRGGARGAATGRRAGGCGGVRRGAGPAAASMRPGRRKTRPCS